MAANVALPPKASDDADADISHAATASRAPLRLGSRTLKAESTEFDSSLADSSDETDDSESDGMIEADAASPIERLTAALSDDALQAQSLPQKSVTTLDARVRIDACMTRARELVEMGQFDQARQVALTAQELGEESQIDFFPDEDRPIDLIRFLDGQTRTRAADLPASPRRPDPVESARLDPETANPAAAPPTEPGDREASGLARIRRDLTSLFRREKKPAARDPATSTESSPPKTPSSPPLAAPDAVVSARASESGDGIVMANRSVSLLDPDFAAPSSSPTEADSVSEPDRAEESGVAGSAETPLLTKLPAFDLPEAIAANAASSPTANAPFEVLPDFEEVDATVPFNEVDARVEEEPPAEAMEEPDPRESNWYYLYTGFGICSLLALICYRRGAT